MFRPSLNALDSSNLFSVKVSASLITIHCAQRINLGRERVSLTKPDFYVKCWEVF